MSSKATKYNTFVNEGEQEEHPQEVETIELEISSCPEVDPKSVEPPKLANKESEGVSPYFLIPILIFLGMIEGAAFQTSGMSAPYAIRGQMTFQIWIVLKMFLAAVGTSMLAQCCMYWYDAERFQKSRKYLKVMAGLPRVIIGSSLLGIGMSLAGSGPTMTPSQMGGRCIDAIITFGGMLAGGLIFGVIEPHVLRTDVSCKADQKPTLDGMFPSFGYPVFALPMGIAMIGGAIALEFIFPQSEDAIKLNVGMTPKLFPTVAGAVVGIMQIPLRFLVGSGQGGSTSVMNLWATLTLGKVSGRFRIENIKQAAQFIYVYIGTLSGALICSYAIPDYKPAEGVGWWQSLVGGFLTIFGARIASGCTCGNGVTGVSELNIQSFIGAACIFGAGIASGYVFQAISI